MTVVANALCGKRISVIERKSEIKPVPDTDDNGTLPSLDVLDAKLHKLRNVSKVPGAVDGSSLGAGLRISSELLAAFLVAGALGYGLDRLLNTGPWFMLVGLLLGFAAGLVNIWRGMSQDAAPPDEK